MFYFCTYFDHHYLPRGLALYQSLRRHCPSFQLRVLCMDRVCYEVLAQLKLSDVHLISLEELENGDKDLLEAKKNRKLIEYYYTCTSSLLLFILNHFPEVEFITYLDADLFFFADPTPIYDEIAGHSIAIIEHRFPANIRDRERYGIYNVGWVSFRRDEHGFGCLRWWRDRCIEWCYDRCEDGRFADQKYLDDWPSRFQGVVVLRHKGANLAPWNLANYGIRLERSRVWVDEQPLIFFHFHGFKKVKGWLYYSNLAGYKVKPSRRIRQSIYAPYIRTLLDVTQQVSPLLTTGFLQNDMKDEMARVHSPQDVGLLDVFRGILARNYIFVTNGRAIW